jgi:DNA-binding MarR family transcriptional regulator
VRPMKGDLSTRFGFLVNDVARLYSREFDRRARESLGLSRAQCRLLGTIAREAVPRTQVELADLLDMTPMGVATLCDRMEAAGLVRRETSPTDGRARLLFLEEKAGPMLETALAISDKVQHRALVGLTAGERRELTRLLLVVHGNLTNTARTGPVPSGDGAEGGRDPSEDAR